MDAAVTEIPRSLWSQHVGCLLNINVFSNALIMYPFCTSRQSIYESTMLKKGQPGGDQDGIQVVPPGLPR